MYGLIAVLTGAGGSFAQLSMYIYSVLALVALAWGLRAVKEARRSPYLVDVSSHIYHRKIPNKHFILPICFLPIIYSPLHGQSSSL